MRAEYNVFCNYVWNVKQSIVREKCQIVSITQKISQNTEILIKTNQILFRVNYFKQIIIRNLYIPK